MNQMISCSYCTFDVLCFSKRSFCKIGAEPGAVEWLHTAEVALVLGLVTVLLWVREPL